MTAQGELAPGTTTPGASRPATGPTLDVVIPVHDEERDLCESVARVDECLRALPYSYRITIADNASTDRTPILAHELAEASPHVRSVRLERKGRGHALKEVWAGSDAHVLVYMDVDLSTDLKALLPLVAPLISGHSDLAIGSRLSRGSRVQRGPKREIISRTYNLLLRSTLRAPFADAQCGFKAIRADVAEQLLPLVRDDAWFFDTELLVLAARSGLRVHEVPVDWVDDPDSRVDLVRTARDDVRGIVRLGWSLARGTVPLSRVSDRLGRLPSQQSSMAGQELTFALVGIASTIAYALLYLGFRLVTGAQAANALALLTTAVANTAANRRLTFGIRGPAALGRHHVQGLMIFAAGLGVTSGSLWLLDAVLGSSHAVLEVLVLTAANLVVTVARFVLMRTWVFVTRD